MRKEGKPHGKPPPLKLQCIKKNEKEQKTIVEQPHLSLQEDLATMRVCAR
jgi:hypothetical protein